MRSYSYRYPHPAVTTDCVVFGFDGEEVNILLIERAKDPCKGEWAFPGGFLNIDETAENGILRELEEETGIKDITVEQVGAFTTVDRDPRERVITLAFYAFIRKQEHHIKGGDDARRACWFPLSKHPQLAFDHQEILEKTLKNLRIKLIFDPFIFKLLDERFTLSQLQAAYEGILGKNIDGTAFQNEIISRSYLVTAGYKGDEILYSLNDTAFRKYTDKQIPY